MGGRDLLIDGANSATVRTLYSIYFTVCTPLSAINGYILLLDTQRWLRRRNLSNLCGTLIAALHSFHVCACPRPWQLTWLTDDTCTCL